MTEKMEKIGDFLFRHVGGNHVIVYPHPTVKTYSCLTMDGNLLKHYIDIPYFHRINKLVIIHLDSSYAKSTLVMEVKLELEAGKSIISKYFTDLLFHEADIQDAEFIEPFGEEFEYEPRTWTLSLKAANTHLLIPVLYIQKLGGIE